MLSERLKTKLRGVADPKSHYDRVMEVLEEGTENECWEILIQCVEAKLTPERLAEIAQFIIDKASAPPKRAVSPAPEGVATLCTRDNGWVRTTGFGGNTNLGIQGSRWLECDGKLPEFLTFVGGEGQIVKIFGSNQNTLASFRCNGKFMVAVKARKFYQRHGIENYADRGDLVSIPVEAQGDTTRHIIVDFG